MKTKPESRRQRLDLESGTVYGQGRRSFALVYPSPYGLGMSSLGFQTVYRLLNALPDTSAHRAFLPEAPGEPLLTYEAGRAVSDYPVMAFSLAYELEITGLLTCLEMAGMQPLAKSRRPSDPLVVVGGPLTFSNPIPIGPFADIVVMGEAENLLAVLADAAFSGASRGQVLHSLAHTPGFYVPSLHGEQLPPVARCDDEALPAYSAITTPRSILPDMFLIEPERGCSRGCSFCVMRRTTNGGMRLVTPDRVQKLIPADAARVGLVGAAVSDHPAIEEIVREIVSTGRGVGISSLRADRLSSELVALLKQGGYRTLTVASDGASEGLRISLEKKIHERHLRRAAELARDAEIDTLKLYMMVGVPGERAEDIEELISFALDLAAQAAPTRLALGVAPFVAKRNTPLDRQPFAGIRSVDKVMKRLRAGLRGEVDVRPTSSRWAWVEYQLAQGGLAAGEKALEAWRAGGKFADWRRAFAAEQSDVSPAAPVIGGNL